MVAKYYNALKDLLIVAVLAALVLGTGEKMAYTDLLMKMANGQQLSDSEKNELMLEARQMEQAASFIRTMIQPGSSTLKVDHLIANDAKIQDAEIISATAGGGDVMIDEQGVWIKNQQAAIGFEDTSNQRFNLYMYGGSSNELGRYNQVVGGGMRDIIKLTNGSTPSLYWNQDSGLNNRTWLAAEGGTNQAIKVDLAGRTVLTTSTVEGDRLTIGGALIDMRTEGSNGTSSTFMRMRETAVTPPEQNAPDAYHMYMKGDKLIIQFCDSVGGMHYFYLNLTATTNQSWIYSATAP